MRSFYTGKLKLYNWDFPWVIQHLINLANLKKSVVDLGSFWSGNCRREKFDRQPPSREGNKQASPINVHHRTEHQSKLWVLVSCTARRVGVCACRQSERAASILRLVLLNTDHHLLSEQADV
ncbi:hypothetical protein J6590_030910 [Homalodisca vitripennis]|nr:hypothetical protein J6590_030910 [Homalodisca vitripennis]